MEVHCDDSVTELERLEIGMWIDLHDTDLIDTVVVGNRVVAVHGTSSLLGLVGTAVRHGDVIAELDTALAVLHAARDA